MSTADEIQMRQEEARPILQEFADNIAIAVKAIHQDNCYSVYGREVCARRARKLRRRGKQVRLWGKTKNGKSRYRWLPWSEIEWA